MTFATPNIPEDEAERLAALVTTGLLDSAPEDDYDRLTVLAAAICDVPISLVSLVDSDRQWFKARRGLNAAETSREVSFCAHAICSPGELFGRDVRLTGTVVVRPTSDGGALVRLVFDAEESPGSATGTGEREFACMCSWCSRARSMRGDWQKLDEYICERYGVLFSHGICADCSDRVLADVDFNVQEGAG